jgi:uncharacterized protein
MGLRAQFLPLVAVVFILSSASAEAQPVAQENAKLRTLIIDGQNNHQWQQTTPLLKKFLEDSGRFTVDVATTPPRSGRGGRGQRNAEAPSDAPTPMSAFKPKFSDYQVVVSNYNGERWPRETEAAFVAFVAGGGGFVTYHAADNAFPDWPEYNLMCGLGGWEGRNQAAGPYVYINDAGEVIRDTSPGRGGNHGSQHEFQVRARDTEHPIMKGLPPVWMHTRDELYDQMRGPAESMHILATAFADRSQRGTGRHEPMLMTIEYGKGRVFHTTLGHADYSVNCVGFITTFTRGAEWAATGKVTIPVPKEFPTPEKSLSVASVDAK